MLPESCKFKFAVLFVIVATVGVDHVTAQSSCNTPDVSSGVCVPILTCQTVEQMLTLSVRPLPRSVIQYIQRSHCGNMNGVHYVCCDPSRVTGGEAANAVALSSPAASGPKARASEDKSDADVQKGMRILEGMKCGKSDADRVSNGEDASLMEFPWMALLVYDDGVSRTLKCGGSLITARYVLTAAHCMRFQSINGQQKLVSVRLGEHDTTSTTDCSGSGRRMKCAPPTQEIDIEESIYHQDYNPSKFSNDIGLIRLVRNAEFKTNVRPVCLPITPNSQKALLKTAIIAGWGKIENGLTASVLQKAVIPVKANDVCQKVHQVVTVTDMQLCAGGENKVDTCKGDSGGPIFYPVKYRKAVRYVQYGVVSSGSKFCGTNYPSLYVKVRSYLPWIAGNIRD